jgi:hypothetical protein
MTTSAPLPRDGQIGSTVMSAIRVRAAGHPCETGEALTANRRVPRMRAAIGAMGATGAGQTAKIRRAQTRTSPVADSSGAERATTTDGRRRASGLPSRPGASRRAELRVHGAAIRGKRTTKTRKAHLDSWAGEVKIRIKAGLTIPGVRAQEALRRAKALS